MREFSAPAGIGDAFALGVKNEANVRGRNPSCSGWGCGAVRVAREGSSPVGWFLVLWEEQAAFVGSLGKRRLSLLPGEGILLAVVLDVCSNELYAAPLAQRVREAALEAPEWVSFHSNKHLEPEAGLVVPGARCL